MNEFTVTNNFSLFIFRSIRNYLKKGMVFDAYSNENLHHYSFAFVT